MIIEYQEKIHNFSDKLSLKGNYEILIRYFGEFLLNLDSQKKHEKIYISYIAYYFKLINNYLIYNNNNDIENLFFQEIEKNIEYLLNEIPFYEPEIICYFIEYFVDCKSLYSKSLLFLAENYYSLIEQLFLENKKILDFKESLRGINEIRKKVNYCENLLKKLKFDSIEFNKLKKTINDYNIALDIREYVKKYKNIKDFSLSSSKLKTLIKRYVESKYIDFDDLLFINNKANLKNKIENENNINFLLKLEKAIGRNDDSFDFLRFILEEYPPKDSYNLIDLKTDYYTDKEKCILKCISLYQNSVDHETSEKNKNIYEKVLIFLNKIKSKNH